MLFVHVMFDMVLYFPIKSWFNYLVQIIKIIQKQMREEAQTPQIIFLVTSSQAFQPQSVNIVVLLSLYSPGTQDFYTFVLFLGHSFG